MCVSFLSKKIFWSDRKNIRNFWIHYCPPCPSCPPPRPPHVVQSTRTAPDPPRFFESFGMSVDASSVHPLHYLYRAKKNIEKADSAEKHARMKGTVHKKKCAMKYKALS